MSLPANKQRSAAPHPRSGEQGSILLEALISGILLVITAVGVFSAFDAGTRSTAEERYRAQAEGLAQADLARLRTMRISALSSLHETKVVTIEKTPYTVESVAAYQTDKTGTASCAKATASADYIQIRSTITWPSIGSRDPVVEQSLVAPPNGSISAHSGSLAIQVENAANGGVEGVGLNGTGAGTFSGVTGANGCAIFGDLPAGNYTLFLSGTNLVDKNGDPPKQQSTSVVEESTNTLALQYDFGGRVAAKFQTRVGGELVPSKADSVVAFNSGMQMAKAFGTAGTPAEEVIASPLFPFTSAYSVYAGTCTANNPILAAESVPEAAIAEPLVSASATTPVTIELPALHLTAWSGTEAAPGERVNGAQVKVTDTKCAPEKPTVRTFTTDASGGLPDPGLPFSTYNVCVAGGGKHVSVAGLSVPADPKAMEAGTTLGVFLGASGAETGACP
jgi:Tfp pilus assembly protein PilV